MFPNHDSNSNIEAFHSTIQGTLDLVGLLGPSPNLHSRDRAAPPPAKPNIQYPLLEEFTVPVC